MASAEALSRMARERLVGISSPKPIGGGWGAFLPTPLGGQLRYFGLGLPIRCSPGGHLRAEQTGKPSGIVTPTELKA